MNKIEQLYEGKAKKVYSTEDPNVVIVSYKDDATAFDGLKKGTITGKGIPFGGSLARTQATGYGLCYFAEEALKCMKNDSFAGKTVVVSGSGNVATYAAEKATQLGGKVVAMCDSNGYIYDANEESLDLEPG